MAQPTVVYVSKASPSGSLPNPHACTALWRRDGDYSTDGQEGETIASVEGEFEGEAGPGECLGGPAEALLVVAGTSEEG